MYRSFFDYALRNLAKLIYKMLGAKAPNYDACGLFRATHSHNPTQGSAPTYEQAHVGLGLLPLASYIIQKEGGIGCSAEAMR